MTDEIGLFEAIYTQRAIRYIKPDPVPDELINRLLEAGVKAPTGGARQMWRFVVIKDEETRNKLGDIYRMGPGSLTTGEMTPQQRRVHRGAQHFREHLQEAPVFILCCIQRYSAPVGIGLGASIYPAVQNILLAARGLGLASLLTTNHKQHEDEVKELLGIPEDVETAALLPIGYPAEGSRYGPTTRKPLSEVVFDERWGSPRNA